MPIFAQSQRISSRDLEQPTDAMFSGGDAVQNLAMEYVAAIETMKAKQLAAEVARVAHKYGRESSEKLRADEKLKIQLQVARAAQEAVDRANTPPLVVVPHNDSVVHGRIVDRTMKVQKAVRVEGVDAAGKVVATGTTDDKGYYRLDMTTTAPAVRLVIRRSPTEVLAEQPVEAPPGGTALWRELVLKPGT